MRNPSRLGNTRKSPLARVEREMVRVRADATRGLTQRPHPSLLPGREKELEDFYLGRAFRILMEKELAEFYF